MDSAKEKDQRKRREMARGEKYIQKNQKRSSCTKKGKLEKKKAYKSQQRNIAVSYQPARKKKIEEAAKNYGAASKGEAAVTPGPGRRHSSRSNLTGSRGKESLERKVLERQLTSVSGGEIILERSPGDNEKRESVGQESKPLCASAEI